MKAIFDAFVLWPFGKNFIFELVTRVRTRYFTVNWNTFLLTVLLTIPLKKYLGSHNDDWHLGKFGILTDASFHSGNFACCREDSDILSTCEPVSKVFRSRLWLRHLFLKTLVFFWLEVIRCGEFLKPWCEQWPLHTYEDIHNKVLQKLSVIRVLTSKSFLSFELVQL